MSAGLADKDSTAAHPGSGEKTSRDHNLRFPGNKLSQTLPNPFGATAGKISTSRPVIPHAGRAKKGAAASTRRQQDSSGPECPPGYNCVIRLHDTNEFPGLSSWYDFTEQSHCQSATAASSTCRSASTHCNQTLMICQWATALIYNKASSNSSPDPQPGNTQTIFSRHQHSASAWAAPDFTRHRRSSLAAAT